MKHGIFSDTLQALNTKNADEGFYYIKLMTNSFNNGNDELLPVLLQVILAAAPLDTKRGLEALEAVGSKESSQGSMALRNALIDFSKLPAARAGEDELNFGRTALIAAGRIQSVEPERVVHELIAFSNIPEIGKSCATLVCGRQALRSALGFSANDPSLVEAAIRPHFEFSQRQGIEACKNTLCVGRNVLTDVRNYLEFSISPYEKLAIDMLDWHDYGRYGLSPWDRHKRGLDQEALLRDQSEIAMFKSALDAFNVQSAKDSGANAPVNKAAVSAPIPRCLVLT